MGLFLKSLFHGNQVKKIEGSKIANNYDTYFRKQNREYCEYLLKVLYHESNKVEDWEVELRQEKDSEVYKVDHNSTDVSRESYNHMQSLQNIFNQGENQVSLTNYKSAVQNLLGLKNELPVIPEDA